MKVICIVIPTLLLLKFDCSTGAFGLKIHFTGLMRSKANYGLMRSKADQAATQFMKYSLVACVRVQRDN